MCRRFLLLLPLLENFSLLYGASPPVEPSPFRHWNCDRVAGEMSAGHALRGAGLGGQREVLLLAAAMLALALLRRGGVQKAGVYAQSMHEDMIQGELAAYLMEKAIGMDLGILR